MLIKNVVGSCYGMWLAVKPTSCSSTGISMSNTVSMSGTNSAMWINKAVNTSVLNQQFYNLTFPVANLNNSNIVYAIAHNVTINGAIYAPFFNVSFFYNVTLSGYIHFTSQTTAIGVTLAGLQAQIGQASPTSTAITTSQMLQMLAIT